jgi:hypothetical protein
MAGFVSSVFSFRLAHNATAARHAGPTFANTFQCDGGWFLLVLLQESWLSKVHEHETE